MLMLELFQLMKRYVLRIWMYSTVLKKNETATMFLLKRTFSSLVESMAHVN